MTRSVSLLAIAFASALLLLAQAPTPAPPNPANQATLRAANGDRTITIANQNGQTYIAADEVRHAQSASDLIAQRLAGHPELIPAVLRAATRFRHYGTEAVGDVPVAMEGDEIAIRTFATRIERLCGTRLVDHLKTAMEF